VVVVVPPTGWQTKVVDLLEAPPDGRTIYWIWEPTGKRGKTQLAKWLCVKRNACYLNGAKRHVLASAFKQADKGCELFVFGVARSREDMNGPPVSYDALEQLKDGLFHSGFGIEATGMCVMNSPHVIVFANEMPDINRLSKDRWKIGEIVDNDINFY
jgi:hypothetical protein